MVGNYIFVFISMVLFCNGILAYTPLFYLDQHCGGTIHVVNHGQIRLKLTSSSLYKNDMRCTVKLEAPAGHQLMVFYKSLNIEKSTNCGYDWIGLHDGMSTASPYITGVKKCGNLPPSGVYHTSGRYMAAYFRSDNSVQKTGFDLIITSYHTGLCITDEYACNNNRCIPAALTCNGYNPCGDYSDCKSPITTLSLPTTESSVDETTESFVQQSSPSTEGCSDCRLPTKYMDDWCGNTIQVEKHQIHLKLTANPAYARNMSCKVTLKVNATSRMMIYFNDMDIEQSGTCEYDYLEMDDGISRYNSYITGGKQCGQTTPTGVYTTTGRYLTLYFRSDDSDQFRGFDMVITTFHTGICHSSEYQCTNYRCISESLKCNGQNPCGDFSDCPAPFVPPSGPVYSPPCDAAYDADCDVQLEYMDDWCGNTIQVEKHQIHLKLTANPAYARNMSCEVTLKVNATSRMMIYFHDMDIEQSGTCEYDYLEMYDGISRYNSYIAGGRRCGQTTPTGVYTTTGRYLTLYFRSDDSDQFRGFDMVITTFHTGICHSSEYQCTNYRCISESLKCNGQNPCGDFSDCPAPFVPPTGPVYSPPCDTAYDADCDVQLVYMEHHCGERIYVAKKHPMRLKLTNHASYQNNFTCEVTMESQRGSQLMVFFRSMNIETQSQCTYDWLELDDGSSRANAYVSGTTKLCGSTAPYGIYNTRGRYLTVYFHSDSSIVGSGFDMISTSYHTGFCGVNEFRCNNGKCISRELRCNGLNPCGDYSDCQGRTATPSFTTIRYLDSSCGTSFNIAPYEQLHLKLTSSGSYRANMACGMRLEVNPGDYMFVTIKALNTEDDCRNDFLGLYDGISRLDALMAGGKQCGTSPPTGVYKTSGRYMYVYFESDSSVEGTGFDLLIQPSVTKYMDTFCGSTINIGDTNQLRLKLTNSYNYPPNLRCQVTIETDYDSMMMFYFRDLRTENNCAYDWLEIDDGSSRSDPYLAGGKQCGHTAPSGVYSSSGRYLTLYFHSDGSTQDTGFDMIITSFHEGVCYSWDSQYNCNNGRCISTNLTCNGYNSCGDYSDCYTRPCHDSEHRCDNGRCIPTDLMCNGLNPCGDFSDCTTTTSTTPRIYTDSWFTSYDDYSLSVGATVGISVGAVVLLVIIILIITACSSRRTTRSTYRLQPQVATINCSEFAAYAYSNPVAVNYAEPPPSYTSIMASSTSNQGTSSIAGVHQPNKK